jgi:iron complex outermembrane receptor protein
VVGDPHRRKLTREPSGERETTNADLSVQWLLGEVILKSLTGYQDHYFTQSYDADFTRRLLYDFNARHDESSSISQELNASGQWSRLKWLVGGYYGQDKFHPYLPLVAPPALGGIGVTATFDSQEESKTLAAFTDMTLSLTDNLRIYGGARIFRDNKTANQNITNTTVVGNIPVPNIPVLPIPQQEVQQFLASILSQIPLPELELAGIDIDRILNGDLPLPDITTLPQSCENLEIEKKSTATTPRLGLQWDLSSRITTYAQAARGFKSGGANYSNCGDTYEPEEVESIEAGIKSTWFDRRLTANLSVFNNDYTNFQALKIAGLSASIVNAPAAKITGGELELTALPIPSLRLNAAVALMHARYTEFVDSDVTNPNAGQQDLSGHALTRAPDYTVNLGAEYTHGLPFQWLNSARLRVEWFRTDDVTYRPYGGEFDSQKAYSLTNAFISLANADQSLQLRFFGKNLADTEYYTFSTGDNIGRFYGPGGDPRRFGAEFVARFY